jgi:sugar (pentulose or hexulose) kinase
MEKYLLSVDCGTQSLRALIFDMQGHIIDKVKIPYEPYFSNRAGWAEQDSELYWGSLCKATRELKQRKPREFAQIGGVGVTAIRDSIVLLDKDGKPLRPVIVWLDERKAKRVYAPFFLVKPFYALAGMGEAIFKTQVDCKANWVMQNEPEIWAKTYKCLQVSGFLNFRLTGKFIDSSASQIGHIPVNYKKIRWSKKNEINMKVFPIEIERLPDLVNPGDIIGEISDSAEVLTGISRGTPVIACGSDKGCETIGMGVVDTSMASLSFGTTATVQTTTPFYCEPLKYMPAYPAPFTGFYNPEVEIFRGYWMISWFRDQFGFKEVSESENSGVPPEELLNRLLSQVPAGSMGLIVQPFWKPGLKFPSQKGAIIGFGDVHTRAHIYRAVIEGLGYALRDGLYRIEKVTRSKVKTLAVSGGASQSDEICQISADIFNLPLVRGETYETSGLGCAMVVAYGIGLYDSMDSAIKSMMRYGRTFTPNPENVEIYDSLYRKVYSKMAKTLSPLNKEIRNITDYPEKID